jgi:hypothetical protein
MVRNLFILLAFCVLVGCTPSFLAPGTRANPIPTSIVTVAKVKAGEVFVKVSGPAGVLSDEIVDDPSLRFANINEITLNAQKRTSVRWVEKIGLRAPEGWEFDIVAQEAIITVTQVRPTQTGVSYRTSITLDLVVSVKVPTEAKLGSYLAVMTVAEVGKRQNSGSVFFNLEVQKPE